MNLIIRKNLHFIFIMLVIVVIYFAYSFYATKGDFSRTGFAYYNYQILMLKRGHLDLNSPLKNDLAKFNNKWYMVWGPGPILFILPFYFFGKINTSDVVYTLTAGLLNIFILWLLIKEYQKFFKLKLTKLKEILLIISFAFCTPNFILSLKGNVWFTSQVIAALYLLTSYLLLGKWLNSKNKPIKTIVLSLFFFILASWTRYTVAVQGIVFLYPLYILYKQRLHKKLLKTIIALFVCIALWLILFFSYNYARFGNPLETGIRYQKGDLRYDKQIKENKIFSLDYLLQNIRLYFFHNALLTIHPPYINYDIEGNSLISVYPIAVLFLGIFLKKIYSIKNRFFMIFVISGMMINFWLLLITLFSGWIQFGLRFTYDIFPLFFIFLIPVIFYLPSLFSLILVLYGMLVQFIGASVFLK